MSFASIRREATGEGWAEVFARSKTPSKARTVVGRGEESPSYFVTPGLSYDVTTININTQSWGQRGKKAGDNTRARRKKKEEKRKNADGGMHKLSAANMIDSY